jgi:hypothetical protein
MYSYTDNTNTNNTTTNKEFCKRFLQIKLQLEKSTVY